MNIISRFVFYITALCHVVFLSACAHNNIIDVKLVNNVPTNLNKAKVNKNVVMVIYPEFDTYVYEHHDSDWLTTFRIPVGQYAKTRLNQELYLITHLKICNSMQEASLHKFSDYILVPEFGLISYSTPALHAFQDAQFSVELKVRILDGTKKEIETVHSKDSGVGSFGPGGKNTNLLVQDAINKTVVQIASKLATIIHE